MRRWLQVLPLLVLAGCAQPGRVERPTRSTDAERRPPPATRSPIEPPRAASSGEPPADPSTVDFTVTARDNQSVDGWRAFAVDGAGGRLFLTGVWGAAPDDVFVVGSEGLVLHFDGRAWASRSGPGSEHYEAVWGHSGQVFIAGMRSPQGGLVRRFDGQRWSSESLLTTAYLSDVWGSGPDNVFAVGGGGAVLHFDGHHWRPQQSGTSQDLLAVWGASATDVFAVGHDGTLIHYDGSAWSARASGTSAHLRAIWGSSGTDVFIAGDETILHYDGSAWTAHPIERTWLAGISGTGPADAIAVGHNGVIVRFDGGRWRGNPQTLLPGAFPSVGGRNRHALDTTFMTDLRAVWVGGGGRAIAVGRGTILTHDGPRP